MRKIAITILTVALSALWILVVLDFRWAYGQGGIPNFPQTIPGNSVVGRIGTAPGPTQAITFLNLAAAMGLSPGANCVNQFLRGLANCATVQNADLANSSVTIGSTVLSLGGTSTFLDGLTSVGLTSGGVIKPASNSTTAMKWTKADGTTSVVTLDTTNARVGVNKTPGAFDLDVNGAANVGGALTFGNATITGLTANNSPNASNDFLVYWNASDNAIRKVTVGSVSSAAVAGVSSLNGLTGGVSVVAGNGITVTAAGVSVTVNSAAVAQTGHGDSDYTILSTDRHVLTTAALTAARTWTLFAANAVPAGTKIEVQDSAGGITSTNTLTIARGSTDTIDGVTSIVLNGAYSNVELESNGTSKWKITRFRRPPAVCIIKTTAATTCDNGGAEANNGTYTTPAGTLYLKVEGVGGGGGGAGSGSGATAGSPGAATTFSTLTGNGGNGGSTAAATNATGGTATGGDENQQGTEGQGPDSSTFHMPGGFGGGTCFGPGGHGGPAGGGAGLVPSANTGAGGGGGGILATPNGGGGGSGAGCFKKLIVSPASALSYGIGTAGAAGVAGTGGAGGGTGAAGKVRVEAYFQ